MREKKKLFPKLKKKISSFLTDESGKITKKDALGLSVGSVLLTGLDEVSARHSNTYFGLPGTNGHVSGGGGNCTVVRSYSQHASGIVNGHYSRNVAGQTSGSCYGGTSSHGSVRHNSHSSSGSGSGSGHGSGGRC